MTDLLQCPACGFIGDLDDFDFAAADETGDEYSEPFDELICNRCNVPVPYEQLAEYEPASEARRSRFIVAMWQDEWRNRRVAAVQKDLF